MRIAIIADFSGVVRGGIEVHAQRLADLILSLGHQSVVVPRSGLASLSLSDFDSLIVEGVFRPTLLRLALLRGFEHIPKVIFTHGSFYEEVHGHEMRRTGTPTSPASWFLKPLVNRKIVGPILENFNAIFTLSAQESRDVKVALRTSSIKVEAMPLLGFSRSKNLDRGPPSHQWPNKGPYVTAVARIHRRKNFIAALRAVEGTNITFILAGQDAGDLPRILAYAARHGMTNFRYLGEVDVETRTSLILGSFATVLPSWFEGVPHGVLESLELGRPCIATCYSYLDPNPGLIPCVPRPAALRDAIQQVLLNPAPPTRPYGHATDGVLVNQVLSRLE